MKYKSNLEGEEIIKKDYRKKIIFSLNDFQEKGHLLQVVTIPPNTNKECILTVSKQKCFIF